MWLVLGLSKSDSSTNFESVPNWLKWDISPSKGVGETPMPVTGGGSERSEI